MPDARETALARRYRNHMAQGGTLTVDDVARMVRFIEARDDEIARLRKSLSEMLDHVSDEQFCYCEYKDHTEPADEGSAVTSAKSALVKSKPPQRKEND